jgi:hypothetical protein
MRAETAKTASERAERDLQRRDTRSHAIKSCGLDKPAFITGAQAKSHFMHPIFGPLEDHPKIIQK